jgi:uncharacterized integral membrane protein (TIGR00698 family)
MTAKIVFFAGLILAASGLISPPVALVAGLIYGFSFTMPYPRQTRTASRWLLQASVVGLGFGMNLHQVVRAGGSGFVYTATGIATTMLLGLFIGRLIVVDRKVSFLINVGTAICGGSAIAAVSPIIHADDEEIAVSLGTVFVLNSIALLVFPFIGFALHLTQSQFGLWAALAIHDTSSVVGAAAKYGNEALAVGTTVKLARALWIVPIALVTAYMMKSKARVQWPWFILFFCLAAICAGVSGFEPPGQGGIDRDALFDRYRIIDEHAQAGGSAAFDSGSAAVGGGGDHIAARDSRGADCAIAALLSCINRDHNCQRGACSAHQLRQAVGLFGTLAPVISRSA